MIHIETGGVIWTVLLPAIVSILCILIFIKDHTLPARKLYLAFPIITAIVVGAWGISEWMLNGHMPDSNARLIAPFVYFFGMFIVYILFFVLASIFLIHHIPTKVLGFIVITVGIVSVAAILYLFFMMGYTMNKVG